MRKHLAAVVLSVVVLLGAGIAFVGIWEREHSNEPLIGRPDAELRIAGATSIRVLNREGTDVVKEIRDERDLSVLAEQFARSPRSYFGDPEPAGTLYRVEVLRDGKLAAYELNDLRGSGSIAGKIYPEHPGRDEVWSLSPEAIGLLTESASPA